MEQRILIKNGIKKHKIHLVGITFLLFLVSLMICTVFIIYIQGNKYIGDEIYRNDYKDMTIWVVDVPLEESLEQQVENLSEVEELSMQDIIYTDYEANVNESDSKGQLVLYEKENNNYKIFNDSLNGYIQSINDIKENEVYVPLSMISIMNINIGDTLIIKIARNNTNAELKVAGYFEDVFMGSSMIGMKTFLISESTFNNIKTIIESNSFNALARVGEMLHIGINKFSSVSNVNKIINEKTEVSQYSICTYSTSAMKNYMTVLQNAFCGIFVSFALILLIATLAVLEHSISGIIEQDFIDFGILKTIGMTTKDIIFINIVQYTIFIILGIILGILIAKPLSYYISITIATTIGVIIPSKYPIILCAITCVIIIALLITYSMYKLNNIKKISPMQAIKAISNSNTVSYKNINYKFSKIHKKQLMLYIAKRQIISSKKRYISTCIIAMLLVFFASTAGRINSWLGEDGKGMMDAFNPADLDMAVQVFGDTDYKQIEQIINQYTEITDEYMLAMPDVFINGSNYTANVITQSDRFHISNGRTCINPDEVVITQTMAQDIGVDIGDTILIRGDKSEYEYTISGIYHCANDMGANLGMTSQGYELIGNNVDNMWCHHYFLADTKSKSGIINEIQNFYGGDVHVHENTWPGLLGIISAMHTLIIFMYIISALFVSVVTIMAGSRIIIAEKTDFNIYRYMGFSSTKLRLNMALRFSIIAFIGALIGTVISNIFTNPLVSLLMRYVGISNFISSLSIEKMIIPGIAIILLFFISAYITTVRLKKQSTILL